MDSLFNIVGEYQQLYDMLTECTDNADIEQVIADTIEAKQGELEVKAAGYVAVIKQMEMEKKACDELEYEWHCKKVIRENAIKRLKEALKDALVATHNEKGIKAGDYTLKVQNNGGVPPIVYTDEEKIPQNLMRIKYEKDAGLIREYLEQHPECEWAYIGKRGTHLAIK